MDERDFLPNSELHHFQMVTPDGQVPVSISILVHVTPPSASPATPHTAVTQQPITPDEVLAFHEALRTFNGDFRTAFTSR
jgi:hypothetical protein